MSLKKFREYFAQETLVHFKQEASRYKSVSKAFDYTVFLAQFVPGILDTLLPDVCQKMFVILPNMLKQQ